MSRKYIRKFTYDIQQPEHQQNQYNSHGLNDLMFNKVHSAKESIQPSVYKSEIDFSRYKGQNMKYSWQQFKKDHPKKTQSSLFSSTRIDNSTTDYNKNLQNSGSALEQKKQKQAYSRAFTKPTSKFFQSKIHQSPPTLRFEREIDNIRSKNPYFNKGMTSSNQNYSSTPNKVPDFVKNRKNDSPLKKKQSGFSIDNFIILKDLAKGNFGEVFIVRQKKTGMILAMKRVEKSFVVKNQLVHQFIRQLKIQSYLDHKYLIKLYYVFDDPKYIYLLMEFGCDGQLYKFISNQKKLSEITISVISQHLLEAISYLHSENILHRDLKPQNIILVYGTVKICDFGWAVYSKEELRSTFCGTPLYFSPQLIKNKRYDDKVDIWAIGVIAYELKFFDSPFQIYDEEDIPKIVTKKINFPQSVPISHEYKEFLSLILEKDPNKRMGSQKLLQLPFITQYNYVQTCLQLCL